MRLTDDAWLALGLVALAEAGPDALTIDALCLRAERSKGSFYHHFESIAAYRERLVAHWRERDTEEIIRLSLAHRESTGQLDALNRLTSHLDMRLEQAMRKLGAQDPIVAHVVREVDRRRTGFLVQLHLATGDFAPDDAELVAQVSYAAFVGFQVIAPEMKAEVSQDAYLRFMRLLTRR